MNREYQDAVAAYGKKAFKAQMGAEAIQYLLKEPDLPKLEKALQKEIEEGSGQRKVASVVSKKLKPSCTPATSRNG